STNSMRRSSASEKTPGTSRSRSRGSKRPRWRRCAGSMAPCWTARPRSGSEIANSSSASTTTPQTTRCRSSGLMSRVGRRGPRFSSATRSTWSGGSDGEPARESVQHYEGCRFLRPADPRLLDRHPGERWVPATLEADLPRADVHPRRQGERQDAPHALLLLPVAEDPPRRRCVGGAEGRRVYRYLPPLRWAQLRTVQGEAAAGRGVGGGVRVLHGPVVVAACRQHGPRRLCRERGTRLPAGEGLPGDPRAL